MWALYFYIEIWWELILCLTPLWFYNLFMLCYGELHSHNYKERQLHDMYRLFLTIQPPHSYAILIATTSESWIEYTSWPQFANQRVSHKLWRLPSLYKGASRNLGGSSYWYSSIQSSSIWTISWYPAWWPFFTFNPHTCETYQRDRSSDDSHK